MIPVTVADDDLGHLIWRDAEQLELFRQRRPMLRASHLVIVLLLPAAVGQDDFQLAVDHALDDADVDRQIDGVDVVELAGAAGNERTVRHEGAVGHAHEPAVLDQPHGILLSKRTGRSHGRRDCGSHQRCPFHYLPHFHCFLHGLSRVMKLTGIRRLRARDPPPPCPHQYFYFCSSNLVLTLLLLSPLES